MSSDHGRRFPREITAGAQVVVIMKSPQYLLQAIVSATDLSRRVSRRADNYTDFGTTISIGPLANRPSTCDSFCFCTRLAVSREHHNPPSASDNNRAIAIDMCSTALLILVSTYIDPRAATK